MTKVYRLVDLFADLVMKKREDDHDQLKRLMEESSETLEADIQRQTAVLKNIAFVVPNGTCFLSQEGHPIAEIKDFQEAMVDIAEQAYSAHTEAQIKIDCLRLGVSSLFEDDKLEADE